MKHKFLMAAALMLSVAHIGNAQNGVRYNYTHSDGVQYVCSVYSDKIIITDATLGSVTHVVVPDSIVYSGTMRPVREISAQAFAYSDIVSVVIPNTVTEIGYEAFSSCDMLETVTIGTGVAEIWETAFSYCGSLATLNYNAVNASVFAFSGSGVLDDCDALATINIGSEVESLPEDLVSSLYPLLGLTHINIAAERMLGISSGYFGSSVNGLSINVPCSQLTAYQTHGVWSALGSVSADCSADTTVSPATDTTHIVVFDTTHVTIYDTIYITVQDTAHVSVYDTVTVTLYDTVTIEQVRYLDSVYCDTLYIHDTVYLTETGFSPAEETPVRVYRSGSSLVVEGAMAGEALRLYDMQGRLVAQYRISGIHHTSPLPKTGAYLVQVGARAAGKLTVAGR